MTSPHGPTLKGSKRVPFTCLGSLCPSTCCGPFQGTKALQAVLTTDDLGSALPHEPSSPVEGVSIFAQIRLTPDDIERLQTAGLDRMIVYRGDAVKPNAYLQLREDGSCAALGRDGLCSIHPSRPTICRAFPFYLDLFAGLCMVDACPGVGKGEKTLDDLSVEIQAAVDMYRFWLDQIV
jgi:Fe-S-cluster containining protein